MKSSPRTHSAFTLIEVALASTIILVGFVGMIEALAIGSEMLDTARKQTLAAQVIQGEIDYLRMQDWSAIQSLADQTQISLSTNPGNPNSNCCHLFGSGLANLTSTDTSFRYGWQVTDVHTADVNGVSVPVLRQVTITVTWKSITNKPHARTFSAYLGKYGLNVSYQKL